MRHVTIRMQSLTFSIPQDRGMSISNDQGKHIMNAILPRGKSDYCTSFEPDP